MAQITTFKLGGPARFYFKTTKPEEVVAGIISAREKNLPYYLIAGGSNTVFSDQGFTGLVIHFQKNKISDEGVIFSGQRVVVSTGINLSKFVEITCRQSLAGLEKLAGIPGCVGGAVVGNAGAYGEYLGDVVEWVEVFDGERIRRIKKSDCGFAYRQSIFKKSDWFVIKACLKLKKGEAKKLVAEAEQITKMRWQKFGRHPVCAGSFFKNVEVAKLSPEILKKIDQTKIVSKQIPVGYLLGEATKNKKLKVGGIEMASFHNNFLLNDGTGTTKDLLTLAKKLKALVHRKFGIELEEEVRFVL